MPRRPRRTALDGTYHVTTRGVARTLIFRDDPVYLLFLRLLLSTVDHWAWTFHVLCLMPNHYHLIVETTGARLSAGLHHANGLYAQRFNTKYDRSGHLFGDRFSTRMIESAEHLEAACLYVLENPVRARLCASPADWPWSASRYGFETA